METLGWRGGCGSCTAHAPLLLCRFLDEVQAHSDVNKMSVQNLATVFGPNILRPRVEDPVTIMEGKSGLAGPRPGPVAARGLAGASKPSPAPGGSSRRPRNFSPGLVTPRRSLGDS